MKGHCPEHDLPFAQAQALLCQDEILRLDRQGPGTYKTHTLRYVHHDEGGDHAGDPAPEAHHQQDREQTGWKGLE